MYLELDKYEKEAIDAAITVLNFNINELKKKFLNANALDWQIIDEAKALLDAEIQLEKILLMSSRYEARAYKL